MAKTVSVPHGGIEQSGGKICVNRDFAAGDIVYNFPQQPVPAFPLFLFLTGLILFIFFAIVHANRLPEPRNTLIGRVLTTDTNESIPGTKIILNSQYGTSTIFSDEDGVFKLRLNLSQAPTDIYIYYEAAGFRPLRQTLVSNAEPISPIEIRLERISATPFPLTPMLPTQQIRQDR